MRFLSIAAGCLSILPLASLSALPNSQSLTSDAALDSTLVDRAAPICNARGYQRSASPCSSSKSSAQACGARCSKDAKCKNFAVGKGYCFLYNVALPNNFKANQRSPYYFSGKACYRPASSPPALSCGLVGYDPTKVATQFSTQQSSLAACSSLCKRTSKCKSMRYGRNTCILYTAPVTGKFSRDANSPFKFYDKACAVSAPSTTSRTSSPGRSSTSLRSSTTRPAGTTSRTTAASSTRTGGASTSSGTTAATSARGGNTSTTSRTTATTSARTSAGTTSTTTTRGASTTTSGAGAGSPVEKTFQEVVIAFDIPNNRGKRQSGGSSSSTSYFSNTISLSGANTGYRELTTDATNALKISLTIPPGSSGQVNNLELLAENQVNFADLTALALIANLASGDPWATGGPFLLGASLPGGNNGAYVAQSPFWTLNLATNEIGAAVNNADGSSTPLVMYYDSGLVKFATSLLAGAQALKPKALLDDANVVTKTGTSTTQGPTATSKPTITITNSGTSATSFSTSGPADAKPTCKSGVTGRPFIIRADTIALLPGTQDYGERITDGVPGLPFGSQLVFTNRATDQSSGKPLYPGVFTLDYQCRLMSSDVGQYATTNGVSGGQIFFDNKGSVSCYCDITTSLSCACGNNLVLGMDAINRLLILSTSQQTNAKFATFRAKFLDQPDDTTTIAATDPTGTAAVAVVTTTAPSTTTSATVKPTCSSAAIGRPFTLKADYSILLPGSNAYADELPNNTPGILFEGKQLVFTMQKSYNGQSLYASVFTLDSACRLVASDNGRYLATPSREGSIGFETSGTEACYCDVTTTSSLSCTCGEFPVLAMDDINRLGIFSTAEHRGMSATIRVQFQDQPDNAPPPVATAPAAICNKAVTGRPFLIRAYDGTALSQTTSGLENPVPDKTPGSVSRDDKRSLVFTNDNDPSLFYINSKCRLVWADRTSQSEFAISDGGVFSFQITGTACSCDVAVIPTLTCKCGDSPVLGLNELNQLAIYSGNEVSGTYKSQTFRVEFDDERRAAEEAAARASSTTITQTLTSTTASMTTTLSAATASSTVGACDYKLVVADTGGYYDAYCGAQIEVTETPAQLKNAASFQNCVSLCNMDSSCKGINFDKQSTTSNCQLFFALKYTSAQSTRYDSAIFVGARQVTTTTATSSATTTSVAAAATCSDPVITSDNGKTFDTDCGVYVGLDDGQASAEVNAKSFSECVNICASRADCLAMRYDNEVVAFGQCHILTVFSGGRQINNPRYDSGVLRTTSITSSTTTATSQTPPPSMATCSSSTITSVNGKVLDTFCHLDMGNGETPTTRIAAASFSDCVNTCALQNGCLGLTFNSQASSDQNCAIYTVLTGGPKAYAGGRDSAVLRSSTGTTTTVTTTASWVNPTCTSFALQYKGGSISGQYAQNSPSDGKIQAVTSLDQATKYTFADSSIISPDGYIWTSEYAGEDWEITARPRSAVPQDGSTTKYAAPCSFKRFTPIGRYLGDLTCHDASDSVRNIFLYCPPQEYAFSPFAGLWFAREVPTAFQCPSVQLTARCVDPDPSCVPGSAQCPACPTDPTNKSGYQLSQCRASDGTCIAADYSSPLCAYTCGASGCSLK
ncbi:unnamed protein product [Zymoseptoria tritici ST99CH_1E4]|uniref:Apple domain-containing protein n=1 Tax=Zymoseptoria tritici ST99CH_1E4 TaxID=1276532 RepID=A0A2H1GST3_ZYMTR|nr:unnamed protein product [Zymoseptoria tritici ST99CH_1E4]